MIQLIKSPMSCKVPQLMIHHRHHNYK